MLVNSQLLGKLLDNPVRPEGESGGAGGRMMGAGKSATPEGAGAALAAGNYTYAVHPPTHTNYVHPLS